MEEENKKVIAHNEKELWDLIRERHDRMIYVLPNGEERILEKNPTDGNRTQSPSPILIELVLRKLQLAETYDYVCRVMEKAFSDCNRDGVTEVVSRIKAADKKNLHGVYDDPIRYQQIIDWLDRWATGFVPESEKMFFETLSPYIPKDSLDLLFEQLPEINAADLKRDWYNKYFPKRKNGMTAKRFFNLCTEVVPWRKIEHGWNYENFKKP